MIRALLLSGALCALALGPADVQSAGNPICFNPRDLPGECKPIRECEPILKLLQSEPLKPETKEFLRKSQCGTTGTEPKVCCVKLWEPLQTTASPMHKDDADLMYDFSNNTEVPSECGKDESREVLDGTVAGINEFPWLALLEYDTLSGERVTRCSGVLISTRHVLTANHCIVLKRSNTMGLHLIAVRLGEFNLRTNPDCVQNAGATSCAEKYISVGISEKSIHIDYNQYSPHQRGDLAVLRLSREIKVTPYIKPICLPTTASLGEKLYVAGWGRTEYDFVSPLKRKLAVPVFDRQACADLYYKKARISLGHGQFCAGGELNEKFCGGYTFDGGPLMAFERDSDGNGRWTCVGIYSIGPEECSLEGYPAVYTRVIDFIPWILVSMGS